MDGIAYQPFAKFKMLELIIQIERHIFAKHQDI